MKERERERQREGDEEFRPMIIQKKNQFYNSKQTRINIGEILFEKLICEKSIFETNTIFFNVNLKEN